MPKYENFSKEELLKIVEKQDQELAQKKYGLVWDAEREPEQVVLDCENNLPVLKRVKGKEIKTGNEEDNILIEGDNYHALTVLNYTHKGKIDVIYIDPPYNTGNRDFIYNDRYVDREDGNRHSKWLNFMEKRLNLAHDLLKETGVIFISIDDNEQAQLKLLCDRIFGQDNLIATLVWNKKNVVQNDAKFFSVNHEYIHCYAKNIQDVVFNLLPRTDELNARYDNPDKDPRGLWTSVALQAKSGSESSKYKIKFSNGVVWEPVPGTFPRLSKESLIKAYKEGRLWFGKSGKNVPRFKKYLNEVKQGVVSNSILLPESVGSTQLAKETIKRILGENIFETPKPVELIKRFIILNSDKNGMILDFMAGSGTTGHAVLELNKEDGGNRKFILCTNNEMNGLEKELREKGKSENEIQEQGICRKITYPRLEKVIKGYKKNGNGEKVEGLGGNLQYFKTDFVRKTKNRDQVRLGLTGKCTEMLCVKENIFNFEIENDNYKIFSSNKKDKFLCVYYNFVEDGIPKFVREIKKIKGRKIIYMFSVDEEVDKSLFSGISDLTVEAIPEKILEEYTRMNKMNIPINKDFIYSDFNKAKKIIFEQNEKDAGARLLRIVLEKTIQKIAQANGVGILKSGGKGEKTALLNDKLKSDDIFSKVEWEENKTYLAIGNYAAHGEYREYNSEQVKNFHKHIQTLLNKFYI
jgi:adenine-specific DNA-methyltransferase